MAKKKEPSEEKKPAAPKAAKKPAEAIDPANNRKFALGGLGANLNEALARNQALKRKSITVTKSPTEMQGVRFDLKHLALQYLFDSPTIPADRVTEIVGPTGEGKTTFALFLAGLFYNQDENPAATILMETENKLMNLAHIRRCLGEDKEMVDYMMQNAFQLMQVFDSKKLDEDFRTTVKTLRGAAGSKNGKLLPDTCPIAVIVDTISKVQSAGEAVGVVEGGGYSDPKALKDTKDITERNPMQFAGEMAAFFRRLPALQAQHNLALILVSHKNTKVDMSSRGASYLPQSYTEKFNVTKRGGNSLNQNASFQLVFTQAGKAMDEETNEQTGAMVNMRMNKNSYGQPGREIVVELRNAALETYDTETHQIQPFQFDDCLAKMLAEKEICDIKPEGGAYTCKELKLRSVSSKVLCAAIHSNPEFKEKVGRALGISGYGNLRYTAPKPVSEEEGEPEVEAESEEPAES